jgi:prepilin-type N-terminal cleavage/methylation domain-containing protein
MKRKESKARQIIQDAYTISELVMALTIIGILSS